MGKIIKGYYKDGVWHEYGGKLYDSIGYNTDGSITQKAISDSLGGVIELINGYKLAIRVHGDADCSNLHPFYFVNDGDSFTLTISYEKAGLALKINSIIMGEEDITTTAYDDGVITIDRVTDNVIINVETASVTDTTMFTKRTTGNGITILNNKALLKGIRGNTYDFGDDVVCNNCMTAYKSYKTNAVGSTPRASTSSSYNQISTNASISPTDGIFFLTLNSDGRNALRVNACVSGHIHYTRFYVKAPSGNGYVAEYGGVRKTQTLNHDNTWEKVSYRHGSYSRVDMGVMNGNASENVQIKLPLVVDLTAMFGAGNEPTLSTCDEIFDNFQYDFTANDYNEWNLIQTVPVDIPTLKGKLNGEGDSVNIFPNNADLPYTSRVEYIEKTSNDSSCFVSDYICTGQDIVIKAKINRKGWVGGNYALVFGTPGVGDSYNRYSLVKGASYSNYYYGLCGARNYSGLSQSLNGNVELTIELSYGSLTINGTTKTSGSTVGSASAQKFKIFPSALALFRELQIYKADALVVDLIPVRIGNEAGIYDRVAEVLLEKEGFTESSTWIIGGDAHNDFKYGMKSAIGEEDNVVYDEIKQIDGVWCAIKRIDNNGNILESEEVYVLDNQTIPTELTVVNQGGENITPVNGTTPTTAPAIMEIQYGAIPSRGGLLGGGLAKGGGDDDEPTDGEEIEYEEEEPDYEEEVSDEEPEESEN